MGRITLSFDNGPHREVTPRVLDVLARYRIKASFFVLGKSLEDAANVRLVERAIAEGHRVGNHSYSHRVPLGEDARPDAVEREIAATERLLDRFAQGERMFRPFGGGGRIGPHLLSAGAVRYLTSNNYSCVLWNCVPEDWIDENAWCDRALADCASRP